MKEYLTIYNTQDWVRVPSDDIIYIHADGNYAELFLCSNKKQVVSIGITVIGIEIENQLIDTCDNFIQVGRSHIINLKYLIHISLGWGKIDLSDGVLGYYTVEVGKESLRALKKHVEEENEIVKEEKGTLKKLIKLMGKKKNGQND